MSLKAKLEAVIYAAEEPVTLAQLSALFAADALEWKAELEAAAAREAALQPYLGEEFAALDTPPEPPFKPLAEADSVTEDELDPASEAPEGGSEPSEIAPDSTEAAEVVASPEEVIAAAEVAPAEPEAQPETEVADSALSPEAELELKRQARQREREIRGILRQLLDELIATYAADGRGVEIREIAGGFRMATKPECHDAVRLFISSRKPILKLSLPALETLAIVAYRQPITAPEVNEIRGVDSSGVFGSLLARKLIATAGRKPVIGRPILYKTTKEFLLRFGLKDVSELPSMEEFEKLAAIELDESESEDAEAKTNPALGPDFNEEASAELEDSPTATNETAETADGNTTPAKADPAAPYTTEQAENEIPSDDHAQESPQEDRQEINVN
jgi:segregation and condensation protein B